VELEHEKKSVKASGYLIQAPTTSMKVVPHAKTSLLLVFAAPKKYSNKANTFVNYSSGRAPCCCH
jgi:hypothetical protein